MTTVDRTTLVEALALSEPPAHPDRPLEVLRTAFDTIERLGGPRGVAEAAVWEYGEHPELMMWHVRDARALIAEALAPRPGLGFTAECALIAGVLDVDDVTAARLIDAVGGAA